MADIVVHQFETEEQAKAYFAVIINSTELKGCFFKSPGPLNLKKESGMSQIESDPKYYVMATTTDVISDFGV